ncbi:MAG: hypothetical protein ACE5JK_04875 [Candidatus Omnitrophota bacterium]
MNKLLITVGIILAVIWACVTAISLGVSSHICDTLSRFTFGIFEGAIANMQNGFYYDVPNKHMPIVAFLFLFSIAFFLYFGVSLKLLNARNTRNAFIIIAFFSILFRLILLPSVPVHENDFYRYLWDGKVFKSGINPYKYAPGDLEHPVGGFTPAEEKELAGLQKLREQNPVYFDRIGHRWAPTIYPPSAQLVFYLSSLIKTDSVIMMKLVFVLFDILTFFLIARILALIGMNPVFSVIYGWSPLVVKEIANSAHYDSVPIFFMLLAIYLIIRSRLFAGAVTMAAAALAKFFPLFLVPVYARRLKVKNLFFFASVFILAYIPFFLWDSTGIKKVFEGLRIYSQMWSYNGSIFVVIESIALWITGNSEAALVTSKLLVTLAMVILIFYLATRRAPGELDIIHRAFIMLAVEPRGRPLVLLLGDPFFMLFSLPQLYNAFMVLDIQLFVFQP